MVLVNYKSVMCHRYVKRWHYACIPNTLLSKYKSCVYIIICHPLISINVFFYIITVANVIKASMCVISRLLSIAQ